MKPDEAEIGKLAFHHIIWFRVVSIPDITVYIEDVECKRILRENNYYFSPSDSKCPQNQITIKSLSVVLILNCIGSLLH